MNIVAGIFALAGAAFNLFMPIVTIGRGSRMLRIEISIADILCMLISHSSELIDFDLGTMVRAISSAPSEISLQFFIGIALLLTPFIAFIGVIQVFSQKKKERSY